MGTASWPHTASCHSGVWAVEAEVLVVANTVGCSQSQVRGQEQAARHCNPRWGKEACTSPKIADSSASTGETQVCCQRGKESPGNETTYNAQSSCVWIDDQDSLSRLCAITSTPLLVQTC